MPERKDDGPRIVYSTGHGRMCPTCGRPADQCACRTKKEPPRGDGVVRVRLETKGRGGKAVSSVSGVPLDEDGLRDLAGKLKKRCGSGGTVKDGVIEIQGDHRDVIVAELEKAGYKVKRAGG